MHNIFGERFLGKREPAWHGLGTVFTDDLSAVDAVIEAGCDYKVFKSPLFAEVSENLNMSLFGDSDVKTNGYIPVTDKFIITREPTQDDPEYRFFGAACSDQYEILENLEIARALDVLTDSWKVDTVGALDNGKVLFIALNAGKIKVGKDRRKGETVEQYFVFTDKKDASEKAKFMFTPIRVVCQNTLIMGERAATVSAEIIHRTGAAQQLQLRVDIIDKLMKAKETSMETLQAMASVEISNEQAMEIIASAYPLPKKRPDQQYLEDEDKTRKVFGNGELAEALFSSANAQQERYDYLYERAETLRNGAFEVYQTISADSEQVAETPWAAYNAVTELADWRSGRGNIDQSAVFGVRASEKVKAFNTAERITRSVS
jgi:hypothetical protein